jgi:hypothetical protein
MGTSQLHVSIWSVSIHILPVTHPDIYFDPNFLLTSGAGIGGLVLAIVIGKFNPNLAIDLYEAGPEISTVGAGIGIWRRTWDIAQDMGLDQVLFEKSLSSLCMYCMHF